MLRLLAVVLAAFATGCTFYTSCPPGGNTNTPSVGGSSNVGASGSGNSTAGVPGLGGALPTGEWVDVTGSLVGVTTDYGNVTFLAAKPDEDRLFAGLSGQGLWESVDGSDTWRAIGTGKGSEAVTNRTTAIQFDPDHPEVFWQAGSYGPAAFRTTDNGDTFERLGTVDIFDGLSIDFSDPQRRTLLAPGHEQGRILWLSTDGGSKWTDLGSKLPEGSPACGFVLVLDANTFLVTCTQFNATAHGIFRSTDAGRTWTQVSESSCWSAPLWATDGSIYWSLESNGGLIKSTDAGLTWKGVFAGSLAMQPIELPDGMIVTATSQYLIGSKDAGGSWSPITSVQPFSPAGVVYSTFQKALFIWTLSTLPEIPARVIERYDFDPSP